MQVRKFEAKTMKDALDMVKNQLGPDAIILSAKDNSKGFGLAGRSSFEITAAVSEETLKKKKFVESRLRPEDRTRIQSAPAKVQRHFIDSMVDRYLVENKPRPEATRTRYIDIDDENNAQPIQAQASNERVKTAAQRAWSAMNSNASLFGLGLVESQNELEEVSQDEFQAVNLNSNLNSNITANMALKTQAKDSFEVESQEIQSLKSELAQLKNVLTQFQKIPQNVVSHSSFPGSDFGLSYDFSPMFEKLLQAGISKDIAGEILTLAQKEMPPIRYKNRALIEGWVARYILDSTRVVEDTQGSKVQIFMGPSGSGKTSSLVKLASHYVINAHKKVALVTTDTLKVGAADQLRIYAQILNVPFAIIRNSQDWDFILQKLSGYDYILCDCPGTNLKTIEEIHFLKRTLPTDMSNVNIHMVLSATSKDQDLSESGRKYKSFGFKDVIFTGIDDSTVHGSIYNFIHEFKVPLHSFGIGSRVPEDFEMATRERVLDLLFKLTKVKKLTE